MSITPRRLTLLSLALCSLAALAACSLGAHAPAAAPPLGEQPAGGSTDRLEIFSSWVTGPEATGLRNLYDLYRRDHPDVDVINATVTAGNTNARAVLRLRMAGDAPPDTFQVRLGHEIIDTWVSQGYMQDLDGLYRTEGWDKVFPKWLLNALSFNGYYWSVPIGVQRANLLWYNNQVFVDNNLQPPKTLDEFFRLADALKVKGITPLAIGDDNASDLTLLFETVLIGTMGPDRYEGLWTGRTDWKGPEVRQSLENLSRLLAYANPDRSTLSGTQASDLVLSGKAAMMIAPDWVVADAASKRKAAILGWSPAPGNAGIFDAFAETFGLPRDVRNRRNAIDWLRLVGSKQGQEAFNSARGSVCARTDCDMNLYSPYAQSTARELTTARIVPSLSRGAAASPGWLTAIDDIMVVFARNQDPASAQKTLFDACVDQKICR